MGKKALLVVDVQYDFLPPDGSLAVPSGDTVLPFIYGLLDRADKEYDLVVASLVRIQSKFCIFTVSQRSELIGL